MGRLFQELRARKLDRLAAAYAVAGWILVQGASILLPTFDAPVWLLRFFIVAVILGFPVAMAAGGVLAGSPPGAEDGAEGQGKRSRRFVALLAIGIAAAVLLTAAGYLLQRTNSGAQASPDTTSVAPPAPNSVAVLPFVNMSGDPAKEYFSDGFAEELLIDLSKTPHLRVAARTSSFSLRGNGMETADIARKLHVRAVVEGSVRQAGNRVRISVQLVNAADGFSMWSASYDRDLTDILVIQDEIARAVTTALASKLLLGEYPSRTAAPAAIDPEAYRMYLQAEAIAHRGNQDDLEKAVELLKTVTAREPHYAQGYSALAGMLRSLVERYSKTEYLVAAETAARQAISLDPANVHALNTLCSLLFDRWQWKEALDAFQKAQAINPNSAENLHMRSNVAYTFNYQAEDLAAELKAAELDPLQAAMQHGLALWYWNNRQYEAAAAAMERVLTIRKGKFQDLDFQCAIEVGRGRFGEARRIAGELSAYFAESPQNSMNCPFYMAVAVNDIASARKLTDAAAADAEKNGGEFVTIGDAYRQIGDLKSAMPWYGRAYEARDSLLLLVPYEGWQTPEPLVSYPPWKALWARPPIREWEAARVTAGKILGIVH